ncbi:MAG: hypothetical protein MR355_00920 [Lachnospiraceae bacterium]|nr:hypothetical protein [Lachnospiraceae bacterium]
MKHRKTKSLLAVFMSVLMVCSLFLTNDMSAWADTSTSFRLRLTPLDGVESISYQIGGAAAVSIEKSAIQQQSPDPSGTVWYNWSYGENVDVGTVVTVTVKLADGYAVDTVAGNTGNKNEDGRYSFTKTIAEASNNEFEIRLATQNSGGGGEPGPGGEPGSGSGASREYPFSSTKTSTISFTGTDSHDGAGMPCTAIYYINGVAAQTQNNGDVTHKTSVTYPYDPNDPNTPKVGENPAVEFEFANPINMRYTEIIINGKDYSSQIPGTKWDVLDAMDLNHQSQTISFILKVPYEGHYDVTANIAIIGENNVSYDSGNSAIAFEVRNATNGTVGYKYDTSYEYPSLSAEGVTYPTSLVAGKTLTIYAKPKEGFDLDYFGLQLDGRPVDWNEIGNPNRDDLKSENGLSFEIPASMANGGKLDITIEFTQSEEQKAAQDAEQKIYFPTGNFLWSNWEQDKETDMFLDHTLVEFVRFTYTDKGGQTVTYDSLEAMNNANHAYLHFDGDPNKGEATLIAGGELTVRLTPRYGYQVVQFGPNGGAFRSNPDKVAEYTFTIANGNCHLGAKCAPVSDKVTSNAEGVSNGGIEINAENAKEFEIGTAVLSVDDTQPSAAEISGFETAASGYVVDSYLDLNLNNVVYRGSEESVWSTEVTELTNKATIALTVSEELSDDVKIIHQKHDGTYELLDATYDAATKTVSFETDSFSKYAIAEKGCNHDFTGQPYISDGKGNHYQVCKICGERSAAEACHGGTATCGTLVVCEVCGAQYGSDDSNHHVLADSRQSETCLCGKMKNINATALDSKVAAKEITYTGSAVSPSVTIDGLTEGVDFTVEKISKTEVGEYTVTVTGIGTYTGTRSVKWFIVKKEDGWQKVDDQWVFYQDGKLETGWVQDGETWYYMNDTGVMQTGWVQDGETWYYMEESGAMKTGWVQDGSTWYYMEDSGAMASGWVQDGSTWYYMEESGAMASGWVQDGSTWYYMEESGAMVSGWKQVGGIWYYMDASGAMKTGWLNDGGTWYYMDASGAMQTGWIIDGGTWYYLYGNGAMAHSTRIGRYYVNASGAWVR